MSFHGASVTSPYLKYITRVNSACPDAAKTPSAFAPVLAKSPNRFAESNSLAERLQNSQRNLWLAASYYHPALTPYLDLKRLTYLLSASDILNDDLAREIDALDDSSLSVTREFPHFYQILDDQRKYVFGRVVEYLGRQNVVSCVVNGYYPQGKENGNFELFSVAFATTSFTLIFDWKQIGEAKMLDIIRPVMENPSVHKIVHHFRSHAALLRTRFGIVVRNYYDVVSAEAMLEKKWNLKSLKSYSVRSFRNRYRNMAFCFKKFPDSDFAGKWSPNAAKLPCRVTDLLQNTTEFYGFVQQVIYLQLIRNCQMAVWMEKCTYKIEEALLDLYAYDPEWMFAGFHTDNPRLPPSGIKMADSDSD